MDFLKLTKDKLDPSEISDLVAHESCGAVAMFAGTTRDNFDGKQVVSLEYEAYDGMAKKEMSNICHELRQRWPDIKNIAMYHRLGLVPVKEASVVIAISSPHRQTCLQALPFALDELKKSVPVWKKEFYKENKADDDDGLKKKKAKLNFDDCNITDEMNIQESLIQITVDEDEIQRRIQAFIERKRDEINKNNLRDFIEDSSEELCARVSSNIYKVKDSKGHLKIRRVENETGPMEGGGETKESQEIFSSVNERLQDVESFLNLEPASIPKDVYQRLKMIEDQISHLMTISPEYSQFVSAKPTIIKQKAKYTVDDIDKIIAQMESNKS